MTDTSGTAYPVAQNPVPAVPAVEPLVLTPEETEAADLLYDELKPMATATARDYVLARTPATMQDYMADKIEADWPAPPPLTREEVESRRRDADSGLRRAEVVPALVRSDPPPANPPPANPPPLNPVVR